METAWTSTPSSGLRQFVRNLLIKLDKICQPTRPVPTDAQGKPAIHYTTVYKVFAKWADDGSLWQAFVASVRHLAEAKKLDLRVLHGDGTNTVAKKGGMASAIPATNTRRARRSLPLSTIMALCERLSQWLPSMRQTWSYCRRACTR
jgi:hypothetical protein